MDYNQLYQKYQEEVEKNKKMEETIDKLSYQLGYAHGAVYQYRKMFYETLEQLKMIGNDQES